MRQVDQWQPSKFEPHTGRWRATCNRALAGANSRLYVELLAHALTKAIPVHVRGKLVDLGYGDGPLSNIRKYLFVNTVFARQAQS